MSVVQLATTLPPAAAPPLDLAFVDQTVARYGRKPDACIPILQALQEHYHWLPPQALRRVCELTDIPAAQLTGVATFYTYFRHRPAGQHRLCVCHGTACHVKGSPLIQDALERLLKLDAEHDTDAQGNFTVEKVACVGCCTLAPVVVIDSTTYGHLAPTTVPGMLQDFLASAGKKKDEAASMSANDAGPEFPEIRVGVGSCCIASGSLKVRQALEQTIERTGIQASIRPVGCVGMCHQTPLVEIVMPDGSRPPERAHSVLASVGGEGGHNGAHTVYAKVAPQDVERIIERHIRPPGFMHRVKSALTRSLDKLLTDEAWEPITKYEMSVRDGQVCAFLGKQLHLATESCGDLDPLDLDAYLAHDGYKALEKTMQKLGAEEVVDEIKEAGLRGRGGAGFLTGEKWALARLQKAPLKYMVCNGDEGDPGAFMDRMILESYPYRVLEGMTIAAYCIGAHEGYLYIRAEYPLAVKRVREALTRLEERHLLGEKILGTDYSLKLQVKEGAGAFVCGEETALIASIEGQRGFPRMRPPYPVEKGLWGRPTCVNNVETLALVPWIIRHGWQAFASLGTAKSKGTKVFALTGKVVRGGLIEVPMGITIRQIVEEIGGGCGPGRKFKAVQIGGPSGGCIPASLGDTPVDYDALNAIGAIMGSGGLVVMDDRDCMVDIARFFLKFTQDQSCGQCTLCRVGTRRMLDILDRLCTGKGAAGDVEKLEALALEVKQGSLCGLGQTAPNPVLTTIKYYPEEYKAHIEGRCPAGKCQALIKYVVTDKCTGCSKCAQQCPVNAIPFTPYKKHEIDLTKCTRCDICRKTCPEEAIEVV